MQFSQNSPAAMKLTDLPCDVLGEVMRRVRQRDRIACMTTCKALHAAAMLPASWRALALTELDRTAVDFLLAHPCPCISVRSRRPDDIAWFLHAVADGGCNAVIQELYIHMGAVKRVPNELLAAVSRHAELRCLAIDVDEVRRTSEVFFPAGHRLQRLERLAIREHSPVTRQLIVWFAGSQPAFPALREVELVVGISDVMVGIDSMHNLRHVVYRCDEDEGGETYEDINMEGASLDVLEIDIGLHTDTRRLCRQLMHASVRRLVLYLNDDYLDISWPMSPDLEELVLGMCVETADVEFDFLTLRDDHPRLASVELMVAAEWLQGPEGPLREHTLVFRHVPQLSEFVAFAPKVHVEPTTRVCISPV